MTKFEVKDINYKPALVELTGSGGDRQVNLYSVIVFSPTGTNTHYVLAENPVHAAGMARCAEECAEWQIHDKLKPLITTVVTKLPMSIQGWGKQKM